jgi:hypothetical protein
VIGHYIKTDFVVYGSPRGRWWRLTFLLRWGLWCPWFHVHRGWEDAVHFTLYLGPLMVSLRWPIRRTA